MPVARLLSMTVQWDAAHLESLVRPLWDYLAVSDSPRPADVIFVFGCRDLAVPARAAELYHDGHAAHVLLTGSLGRMTRGVFEKAEALVFRDHLVEAGVPEGAVTTEPRATNTLENVRLGMAALEARGVPVGSALLVAKGFLMRRCIATFAQQFSGVRVQACPPRGGIRRALDRSTSTFAARLVAEVERLDRYATQGDICRQEIPEPIRAAVQHVRAGLDTATARADLGA